MGMDSCRHGSSFSNSRHRIQLVRDQPRAHEQIKHKIMPDFERVFRDLELHVTNDPQAKEVVKARHAGEDHARKQILWIALGLISLGSIGYIITHMV